MKHKHADLIHAWADGAEIQYHESWDEVGFWRDTENPGWTPGTEYRIKPQLKGKYRVAIFKRNSAIWTNSANTESEAQYYEQHYDFVRWDGDWKEYEV